MVVADTSFLIDVLLGDGAAVSRLRELAVRREPLWMPAPALHELCYGARLHRHADRELRRIEGLERAVPVLPLDARAARRAGVLEAQLEEAGARPSRADVQVAAIALAHGEPVVTRDRAFGRFPDLVTVSY